MKNSDTGSFIVNFNLNGKDVKAEISASTLLLDLIRNTFNMKGTKPGCNEGECGACTVLINDVPVNSCLYLAANINGKTVTTIEGISCNDGSLSAVQDSLVKNGAVQCGFCTSGMALCIKALMFEYENLVNSKLTGKKPKLTENDVKKWLEGNLCRCTGYVNIIKSALELINNVERKSG